MPAERSFAITLRNVTTLTLTRASMNLAHGEWSNAGNDVPPQEIGPMNVGGVYWSSESDGFATGTEGSVTYDTPAGQILIGWNNPFFGSNGFGAQAPPGFIFIPPVPDIGGHNVAIDIILVQG